MGRNKVNPILKKISLTISVTFFIWQIAQDKGTHEIVEAVKLGLWAKSHNVSEASLVALKQEYEAKIVKLHKIIEEKP